MARTVYHFFDCNVTLECVAQAIVSICQPVTCWGKRCDVTKRQPSCEMNWRSGAASQSSVLGSPDTS